MAEHEINVAQFLPEFGFISAQSQTRKICRMEIFADGFEAVIAAARTFKPETSFAKR